MFIGRGQKFDPPKPSAYLTELHPECGDFTKSAETLPLLIREDIKEYRMNENAMKPNDPLLDKTVRRAFEAFKLPNRVPPIHLNDVFSQELPIWNSSPGFPWTQSGYETNGDIRRDPEAIQRVRHFWYRIKTGQDIELPDCCAYVRSHICEVGETKVKAIWDYPATVTFAEAMFALPLIRAYQQYQTPLAYGYETGVDGMRKIFQQFKGSHFLGIDFSKFDKSLPSWLMEIAFDMLAYNLDFTKYQDYGVPLARQLLRMWDTISDYFINTKIRMCNGERYMKKAGLASGSYFTQLVGSICNYILLNYAALKCDAGIENVFVFGDDSLMSTFDYFTPDHVQSILGPLGMTVNVAKSGFSTNISNLTFLGYKFNGGYPLKDKTKNVMNIMGII